MSYRFAIGLTATLTTAFIAIFEFSNTLATSAKEPLLLEQMKLCLSASEAAATLAVTGSPEKFEENYEKFWTLYWGPLAVVEEYSGDRSKGVVSKAMIAYGKALNELEEKDIRPPLEARFRSLSLNLAHSCCQLLTGRAETGLQASLRNIFHSPQSCPGRRTD